MAKIKKEHQLFIVQSLARFDSPSEVSDAMKAEFGVSISRQAIEHYDPTKGVATKRLAEEHRALFYATRLQYTIDVSNIGLAHRVYRLWQLSEILQRAKERGNDYLMLAVLEQAAKEMGGFYERRVTRGKNDEAALASVLRVRASELPTVQTWRVM